MSADGKSSAEKGSAEKGSAETGTVAVVAIGRNEGERLVNRWRTEAALGRSSFRTTSLGHAHGVGHSASGRDFERCPCRV